MSILVVDVGSSGVRAAVVDPDGVVGHLHYVPVLPNTPAPGLLEIDGTVIADAVLAVAERAAADSGPLDGVGIANQRASTLLWDRKTGRPVGPGLGWQDLRTVFTCLELQGQGLRLAPNASATKLAALLDEHDPDRHADLCFGTIDTWVAWTLSGGALHVTDATNAAVTGLVNRSVGDWDDTVLEILRIPRHILPDIVDSSGLLGEARAIPGSPVIAGIAGDQQASLIGQGCTRPGLAKATFGTGGMLDCFVGDTPPPFSPRGEAGTFPVVAWRRAGHTTWGVEAMMLSAGSCLEWLRDDLGILTTAAESDEVAARCTAAGDLWFVPALMGLGTPVWDFGARGTLVGVTRGSGRPELVRAVLEGVAHRGADLVDAAEADTGLEIPTLRVDGGMSANHTFLQSLADAIGRPVEVSPVLEATTLGAAYLAGMALGTWKNEEDVAAAWRPSRVVEPTVGPDARATWRSRWLTARQRAERTLPDLSELSF
jgi:glycerol kinase